MRKIPKKTWARLRIALRVAKFVYQNRKAEIALLSSALALASELARYLR